MEEPPLWDCPSVSGPKVSSQPAPPCPVPRVDHDLRNFGPLLAAYAPGSAHPCYVVQNRVL
jgi:hypothetical protein